MDFVGRDGEERTHELIGEYRIRECLDRSFLYSSAFVVDKIRGSGDVPDAFVLKGAGWGHGVGLCQMGALGMALGSFGYEEVLTNYFPGAMLKKAYE